MRSRLTQSLTALILAVSMAVTGYAAASARGQTVAGGRVLVLCSGGGLVQVTLEESGVPSGKSHLCPDLAFGLLAALEIAAPAIGAPSVLLSEAVQPSLIAGLRDQARAAPQARGPPVRL